MSDTFLYVLNVMFSATGALFFAEDIRMFTVRGWEGLLPSAYTGTKEKVAVLSDKPAAG